MSNCQKIAPGTLILGMVLSSITLSMSIILNSILSYTIFSEDDLRTKLNLYLGMFSLANCLLSINCILDLISMLYEGWIFGNTFCKISTFSFETFIILSTLMLLLVCIDRYRQVFNMQYNHNSRTIFYICLSIAIFISVLSSIPFGVIFEVDTNSCGKIVFFYFIDMPSDCEKNRPYSRVIFMSGDYYISFSCGYYVHFEHKNNILYLSTPQEFWWNSRRGL